MVKKRKDAGAQLVCEDNHLLKALLGEYDQNLKHIEKALQIAIHVRGNSVSMHGREEHIHLAMRLLQELYFLMESNHHPIHPQEIDLALKMLRKADTLLVRMPEEFHGWRRPSRQLLQQLYLMAWFAKYRTKESKETIPALD